MACCGKKTVIKAAHIVAGYTRLAMGKKYEFTDSRIRVCKTCEHNYWVGKMLFCGICLCYIPAKARVKNERCPKNKWKSN
jgi:hypothetical protein